MSLSYEVEVKIPIEDMNTIEKALLRAGGHRLNTEIQTDMYYDHPCRSFSQTDESVRLRTREPVDTTPLLALEHAPIELTYKGPKVDVTTKTRLEYTTGVSDLASAISILQLTGFRPVATIRKHRVFFNLDGITVSLDRVDSLGQFMELELIVEGDTSIDSARTRVLSVVQRLGLEQVKLIRESYLELYLKRKT